MTVRTQRHRGVPGVRAYKKRRTRLALIDAALDLFLEHGYETTTVDAVAAAVGVSQRTFFRYFPNKDEVVLTPFGELGAAITEALRARPAQEPPLAALHAAARTALTAHCGTGGPASVERFAKVQWVLRDNPALAARQLFRAAGVDRALVAGVLDRRAEDPEAPLRAELTARVFAAAFRVALQTWADRPPATLEGLLSDLDRTMALVAVREPSDQGTASASGAGDPRAITGESP
ncbi:TetR family transcriptional regulator [Allonocardiopsis opalescens]|uniref:TetR family transcriptional regulator n=1 Tax=Allonocardiopsis opalescens TaxID=1144618 RepID=A0A2T0Q0D1_9ACTN|nr:TetR family transcriptional regulator [Allonocardiopsis opalescens]PRX97238.1 TetR family transcriptional regulator [Allonocardiopsis opalescens]